MVKITIKSITKRINTLFNSYVFTLFFFMSGFGFFLGIYSTSLWFIQNTGSMPNFLIIILRIFDILIWIGVVFIAIKLFFGILKKIDKISKRGKK